MDNLVWDTSGNANAGFFRIAWATRKVLIACAISVLMSLRDWGQVGAPALLIGALLHLVFALGAIALLVYTLQRFSRTMKTR